MNCYFLVNNPKSSSNKACIQQTLPFLWFFLTKYSSLSNNHAGCIENAGWKNLQNLAYFKNQKVFQIILDFSMTKHD